MKTYYTDFYFIKIDSDCSLLKLLKIVVSHFDKIVLLLNASVFWGNLTSFPNPNTAGAGRRSVTFCN